MWTRTSLIPRLFPTRFVSALDKINRILQHTSWGTGKMQIQDGRHTELSLMSAVALYHMQNPSRFPLRFSSKL